MLTNYQSKEGVLKVVKRDGRRVPFVKDKIVSAMMKAFSQERSDADHKDKGQFEYFAIGVAEDIFKHFKGESEPPGVEEIQDLVERRLMGSRYKDVAKAYVLYRNDRTRAREMNSEFMKEMRDKILAADVQNQNANVDEKSFGGRFGEAAETSLRKFALDWLVSETTRENHLNNEVYIHDFGHYALGDHNCLTMPIDKLLANGFNTRQTDVRPANSISTALQLVAVLFQLQSLQQFGGVSASHIDHSMVPYVRKSFYKHYKDGMTYVAELGLEDFEYGYITDDTPITDSLYTKFENVYKYAMDMTVRETEQAVEGLYHNLNTLQSRSGNQLPFTSINYGTCTLPEGRMVTKALLNMSIKGNGKIGKTPIFPCGIFQCMKGINREPEDPNYDLFKLALKSTSMRLYPNYANCDWSGNAGYDPDDPNTYFSTINLVA